MLIPYKDINPSRRPPVVTTLLIAINCFVFIWAWVQAGFSSQGYNAIVYYMGLVPSRLLSFELIHSHNSPIPVIITPITAMFMHGGFLHIAGNMLYLWIFGNNVEDHFGHAKFFFFYIFTGLLASAAHLVMSLGSDVPMIGASGAIAGVMGAYFVLWPRARIRTLLFLFIFVTVIELPAVIVLGLWIVMQVLEGFSTIGHGAGVAFFAHIGGFLAGMFLTSKGKKKRKVRLLN